MKSFIKKYRYFWIPETKLDEIAVLSKENFNLGSHVKMNVTIEFYVASDPWNKSFKISCGGLTWPDLDLDPSFARALCLYLTFIIPSEALWRSLDSKLSLVFPRHMIRRKGSALTFELTLTRELTFPRKLWDRLSISGDCSNALMVLFGCLLGAANFVWTLLSANEVVVVVVMQI